MVVWWDRMGDKNKQYVGCLLKISGQNWIIESSIISFLGYKKKGEEKCIFSISLSGIQVQSKVQ